MKRPALAVVVCLSLLAGCADDDEARLGDRQNDILADPFGYGPSADDAAEREATRERRKLGEETPLLSDDDGNDLTRP